MCYSKEVSLATSGVIFAGTGYAWSRYYLQDKNSQAKKIDPRIRAFIKYSLLGFAAVGMHQLFEFLSIWSGNQIVYKIGLLISISCMFFLMYALEKLVGKQFGGKAFLAAIIGIGLYMFNRDMQFENAHFYVRGFSHLAWSMTWMMLFLYWNLCIVTAAHQMKLGRSRTLLLAYPWVFTNASYALMLAYVFAAMTSRESVTMNGLLSCTGLTSALADYQGIYDVASIWCALACVSILLIPRYLRTLRDEFQIKDLAPVAGLSVARGIVYIGLSASLLLFLNYYLPIFTYLGLKMYTK